MKSKESKRDFSKVSNESLLLSQQHLEYANGSMNSLYDRVVEDLKNNLVSKDYVDSLRERLIGRINRNSKMIDLIDTELYSRVKSYCGKGVTTADVMVGLVSEYETELRNHQNRTSSEKKIEQSKSNKFEGKVVRED